MKLYLMNTAPPIGPQHKGLLDGALVLSLFLNVPVSVHFHGDFRSFFFRVLEIKATLILLLCTHQTRQTTLCHCWRMRISGGGKMRLAT